MIDNATQIEEKLFEYVRKSTHADVNKINRETLLFREGIFDSMGFVLLIDYLEENFGIKASDTDLIEENFESVKAITHYVQQKKAAKAA
ncbi:MAG: acyl carrier protein [Bacteroidales bacterium]|nr:acyl carrier protein [Bacteroidales bacterium]MBN2762689.1 acyl carrier protein [Bacteroidales bacterium]